MPYTSLPAGAQPFGFEGDYILNGRIYNASGQDTGAAPTGGGGGTLSSLLSTYGSGSPTAQSFLGGATTPSGGSISQRPSGGGVASPATPLGGAITPTTGSFIGGTSAPTVAPTAAAPAAAPLSLGAPRLNQYGFEEMGQWVKDPATGQFVYNPGGASAATTTPTQAGAGPGTLDFLDDTTGQPIDLASLGLSQGDADWYRQQAPRYFKGDIGNSPEFQGYWGQYGDPSDTASFWESSQGADWLRNARSGGDAERDRQAAADKDSGLGTLLGVGGLALGGFGLAGMGPLGGLLGGASGAGAAGAGMTLGDASLGAFYGDLGGAAAAAGGAAGAGGLLSGTGITGGDLLRGGATLAGAGINYLGATNAAEAQQQAAQSQQELLRSMYGQNRSDLLPWMAAGKGALGNLVGLTTPGNQLDQAMLDPGYAFRQSEGEKGINRAAAARGLWDSGRTYKALDRFNQDYATGEFGNVFNRNAALAGIGQTAVGQGVQAGQTYGQNAGESMLQGGNARASGYVGGANAISGGLGNLVNYYNQQALLDQILRRG